MVQPRFNHMELTFPRGALTDETRKDIESFYCGVFGWDMQPFPMDPNCPVLSLDEHGGQFILLAEVDEPMPPPPDFGFEPGQHMYVQHLGLYYENLTDVAEVLEKCERFQEKDDRVRIRAFPEFEADNITSRVFYLNYLLPIWFDVQCFKWAPGSGPDKAWRYVDIDAG